jgi:hypothetical protein
MLSDPLRPVRAAILASWALASAFGCGDAGGRFEEMSGPEALRRLPAQVAELTPPDVVLCLDDARPDGSYRIWILRHAGGSWLKIPTGSSRDKSASRPDSHDMPPSALLGVLRSRLPDLDPGEPAERRCRFTHWRLPDGAEVQLRELLTDRGWFASVERVAM